MRNILLILCLAPCCVGNAQEVSVVTEYITRSDMNDADGNRVGDGNMFRITGLATLPLSTRSDTKGVARMWSATLKTSFAIMDNGGMAATVNPDRLLNASLNVSHMRRLSDRWRLIASLGAGVYAAPSEIGWRSILANGAAIFAYKVSDNLSIGVGGGLTNSYGVPMILPMGYIDWRTNGDIKVQVNMAGGMSVKASTMFGKHFGLELTAIEFDGMSAVRRIDGETKIYSSMMVRSSLSPTFSISKKMKMRLDIGGMWLRSARVTDRSLKEFFKSFGDDDGKYHFKPTLRVNVGVSYKI